MRYFAVSALLGVVAAGGDAPPPNPLTGVVVESPGLDLRVRAGKQTVTFGVTADTIVFKHGTFHDLSRIEAGDSARISWHRTWSRLVADRISAAVDFAGIVGRADPGRLEVRDAATNEVREVWIVRATVIGVASRHLAEGEQIRVSGWDLGGGRVEAVRIAVFNTDSPATVR